MLMGGGPPTICEGGVRACPARIDEKVSTSTDPQGNSFVWPREVLVLLSFCLGSKVSRPVLRQGTDKARWDNYKEGPGWFIGGSVDQSSALGAKKRGVTHQDIRRNNSAGVGPDQGGSSGAATVARSWPGKVAAAAAAGRLRMELVLV